MNRTVSLMMSVKQDGKWTTVPAPEKRLPKLKEGSYRIYWYEGTQRRSEAVGQSPDVAIAALTRKRAEMGYQAAGGKVEPKKATALRTAVEQYLSDVQQQRAKKTYTAYAYSLELFLECCTKENVEDITENDIKEFIRFLWKKSGLEARSDHNIVANVGTFLRAHNVMVTKKPLKGLNYDEKIVEPYTPEELTAFFNACTPDELLVFKFFLGSGCREGEVAHMEVRDINFRKNVLHVQPKPDRKWKIKDHEDRFVPLAAALVERLKVLTHGMKPTDLLFPNTQGNPEGHFLRQVERIAKRAKLTGKYGLHKFRKTFATLHHESGISARTLQGWLGHSDLKTTLLYLKGTEAADTAIQEKVNSGTMGAFA